jgi:hypothetical protein
MFGTFGPLVWKRVFQKDWSNKTIMSTEIKQQHKAFNKDEKST